MSLADRLRELAECLPPGGSLTITREGLLQLAAVNEANPDQAAARGEFTIGELANRFHRSPSTIRDWCEHGRFEDAFKLNGRDWRIPRAAVDGFVAQQRRHLEGSPARLAAWRAIRRSG